ncbi:MAG: CoB--CoM heterodisulfide reductase iron-sulfur subunit B family protein [Gemmatimonadales bacterium]|jgi:heterodisulfide reductase subunit B
MKRYAYFPGCSAETVSASYHLSTIETGAKLGVQFEEIEDWNCCGATPYTNIDELLAHTLCARNLAIAERTGLDVVAPCNACFKNLYHANQDLKKDADLAEHMNFALEADGLHYGGAVNVHHLIHVFVRDVGLDAIKQKVTRPLKGLKVAAYYGCQLVRPDRNDGFDATGPRYFEDLVAALGAKPVEFAHRLRCCGASLMIGFRRAALAMVHELLRGAAQAHADVIATACPLCQLNLECYQRDVNREFGTAYEIPVLYFTQLMGLAMGISAKKLGIGTEMISPKAVLECVARKPAAAAPAHNVKVGQP